MTCFQEIEMDKRIKYSIIEDSYGCDNCKHENDGMWYDYCRICSIGNYGPPTKYRPKKRTIQEKLWYHQFDKISYQEYMRFLKNK